MMKANPYKCHLLLNSNNKQEIEIAEEVIISSQYARLLAITIDHKFSFNIYVDDLCKKTNRKLHALARVKCT